ncbi:MAG: Mur ligase family protein [Eubacteriales bacterium]|nr:Mur ligase family protein [Eubacteriales bacterium]
MKRNDEQAIVNEQAAVYIEELAGRRVKNGLDNIRRLLPPEPVGKVIHVTGTNGKGSVCAFLTSIYQQAGYRVGVFTSPHLIDVRERIRINHEWIGEARFAELVLRLRDRAVRLEEAENIRFGFFEFLLAVAMTWFQEEAVDLIILEVGIGGLYDATNYIKHPAAAVIASISLDHEDILGHSLAEVASQKAGIIKNAAPLIYLQEEAATAAVIEQTAADRQASAVYKVSAADYQLKGAVPGGLACCLFGAAYVLPTLGRYQVQNAAIAWRTVQALQPSFPVTASQLAAGIEQFSWPGRLERVRDGIYLDGGHNPAGIRALLESVKPLKGEKKLLFAVVKDKKYDTMIQELAAAAVFDDISIVGLRTARRTETNELAELFRSGCHCPVTVYSSVPEAMDSLLTQHQFADERLLLCCTGSLYLVGEIKEYLYDQF